tara:strand:+ start:6388 stop:7089 length:702 start_codon:yes stop_codon:yes gene_type:complete
MRSEYQPLPKRDETFLDTETTGLDPVVNEVVEFAAVKRDASGKVVGSLHLNIRALYVNEPPPWAAGLPGFDRDAWADNIQYALGVNGLTIEEITSEDRMHPDEAARQIAAFIKNTTVIGQNPDFDMEFIKQLVLRAGLTQKDRDGNTVPLRLPYHKIDTCTLAYEHLRLAGLTKLSLSKDGGICDFLGIEIKGAHTAMGDVAMTIAVYDGLARASWVNRLIWWLKNRKGGKDA